MIGKLKWSKDKDGLSDILLNSQTAAFWNIHSSCIYIHSYIHPPPSSPFLHKWYRCKCVLFFYGWWPQCLPSTMGTPVMCIVSCWGSTAIHHYFICWNLIGSYQTLLILPFHFKHCCRKDKCPCCLEWGRKREDSSPAPTNLSGFVRSMAISSSVPV